MDQGRNQDSVDENQQTCGKVWTEKLGHVDLFWDKNLSNNFTIHGHKSFLQKVMQLQKIMLLHDDMFYHEQKDNVWRLIALELTNFKW